MAPPLFDSPLRMTRRSHLNNIDMVNTRHGKRSRNSIDDDEPQPTIKKQRVKTESHPSKLVALSKPSKSIAKTSMKRVVQPKPQPSKENVGLKIGRNTSKRAHFDSITLNGEVPAPSEKPAVIKQEKRTLRSRDGVFRTKSDLSLYFPGYEEMLSNEPKTPDYLTPESSVYIVDESTTNQSWAHIFPRMKPSPGKEKARNSIKTNELAPPGSQFLNSTYANLNNAQKIDFTTIAKAAVQVRDDPLSGEAYRKAHKRAERQEKQLRNIEREHAQHEKSQLERILDGLRGHDWLRIMGISGITETEKKEYEPKRDMFIREVVALIEKFKVWKEEEKRRKLAKDHTIQAEEEAVAAAEEGTGTEPEVPPEEEEEDGLSDGDPPDYQEIDEWAARQLHQEAISATENRATPNLFMPQPTPNPETTTEPQKPFTSFYDKPYLRAAAIGNHRRSQRSASAFGRPIPEVESDEFILPSDLLTTEAKRASARAKRRVRRHSKET